MTAPIAKMIRPIAPCWIVRQVGSAVELACVGVVDVAVTELVLGKLREAFNVLKLFACEDLAETDPNRAIGLRIENADSDAVWRATVRTLRAIGEGRGSAGLKEAHDGIVLLAINLPEYLVLAKKLGLS